jgi:hypothetical protein
MNRNHRAQRRSTAINLWALAFIATLAGSTTGSLLPDASACERQPDMPAHVPRLIDASLTPAEYAQRITQWSAYAEAHPQSAMALVELERAQRYARQIQSPESLALIRRAVAVEPECAVALARLAALEFEHTIWGDRSQLPRARELAERAIAVAPLDWEPHLTLWTLDIVAGTGTHAADHMAACLDKGAFASPLLDYGYNMLSTAAPDAIVFTNGDHDTFPLLALQARYGIRPDVRIVNLSMATFPSYAKWALNSGARTRSPLSNADIDVLQKAQKPGTFFGAAVLQEVARRVAAGRWDQPVYGAVTVVDLTSMIPNRLEMQGLLLRIGRETTTNTDEAMHLDVARTDSLLEYVYRMESAMDLGFQWESQPAIAQMMGSYVGSYRRLLAEYAAAGDLEAARRMLRNILPLLEFHGMLRHWDGRDRAEMLLVYWQELDPDNPEVERWRQRLQL